MSTSSKLPFRVGLGYDIHPFAQGRKLILAGLQIPHPRGLDGHSDADVLSHALADAIFGALGLPDIGHFFPNNDPACKDMNSLLIVERAVHEADLRDYEIGNVDITLIAEEPKIAPYLETMKTNLAQVLQVEPTEIGLKATTNEKIGDLGRGQGIAAHSVALLVRR